MIRIEKIIYLVVVLFVLLACAAEEQEVIETRNYFKQNVLVLNYTAASCYNCGSWGAPLIHDLEQSNDVIAICVHSLSDPMYSSSMLSFKSQRETGGEIPVFWVGDIKTTDEESTRNAVNLIKTNLAVAELELSYFITDTNMYVHVQSTFGFKHKGIYNLSVFLLEDGIDGSSSTGFYRQSGTLHSYPNNDFTHDYVLRSSSTGNEAYGEMIVENPGKNQVVTKSFSFDIKNNPKENIYPIAVLWKYDPESDKPLYKFVNAIK